MELGECQKRLLSLSFRNLQSLCKQYNLPANKSRWELASELAMLLEKEKLNSGPELEKIIGSTQASPSTCSAVLSNIKEASRCVQENHKRDSYSDRGGDDRLHVKHQKGLQTQIDEALQSDIGARMSLPPVSLNNGKCSGQGIAQNAKSQSAYGIATNLTPPGHAIEINHDSASHVKDKISFVASHPGLNGVVAEPHSCTKVGANVVVKAIGSTNEISANANANAKAKAKEKEKEKEKANTNTKAAPFQFFVMSEDEGLDLVVDLNFNPASWVRSFNEGLNIPPSTHQSEKGILSDSISSLVGKNDQNTISSLGSITVDTENRAADSIAPRTNSSLGPHSTDGYNSHSGPHPADTINVNSNSSASTLPGTFAEVSGSQEWVPVVHSSCLSSDVQNNMPLGMLAGTLCNNVLPQESVGVSVWSERNHAPAADDSIQATTNKDTFSPGYEVISDSNEISFPLSVEKEMLDGTSGVQPGHSGTNDTPKENVLMEAVPMEEDNCNADRLSSQIARQTVAELPVTDASSADCRIAGNFDLSGPTPSSAASDNAITPLALKDGAKTARSHDSVDKKGPRDTEELHDAPTRNILFSLRSASARQKNPSPRRSARLVPK
ncbi:uncharacterized protein LOC100839736 isoform X1 [Brachypodium distachyon]|uniref:Uncharacterized protein n=1 Tax=Brachypodium distachyon TaxID=15368 RepID=I1IME1_BRADI|nr:uncharacterized protein LOC100839736 isoform X1 [Brachypodium distachyon]XP_010237808.1 uncharacterized protein LOC100839736 isoform X1 [Brachypodium distachyon]XP_024310564.1 uncharacterized protein LOC100839736 isoform X1 [Brachypodium distachyon]KQJ88857.1 hypothetical protein BRADI_4g21770v3 [Brachypodium distachyon]KQJ88860.1 hypothetical protein BRADI_4g21770v3 [Brachypodium distachyon]|eukprot:XP_010237807.1 uncharacterized protein LOC100839736 isoform X1 [Brachypodium distachyon]